MSGANGEVGAELDDVGVLEGDGPVALSAQSPVLPQHPAPAARLVRVGPDGGSPAVGVGAQDRGGEVDHGSVLSDSEHGRRGWRHRRPGR